jgi:multiple sugar transport system substrate-binding protein
MLKLSGILTAGSLLAACGPTPTPPATEAPKAEATKAPEPTATPVAEPTATPVVTPVSTVAEAPAVQGVAGKITVWGWPAADKAYESFLPDFKKAYPDIELDIQMMPGGDEHNKLLAALAAGAGAPDVGMIEINQIDKFVVKGGLEDLLGEPYNGGQYKKDMVEYKWRQGTSPDGRLVAFPWDIGPATFFYRRDLFEEAGLPSDPAEVGKLTNTWAGFIDVCKKLTNPDKQRWAISTAADIPYTNFAHRNFFDDQWNVIVDKGLAVDLLKIAQEARQAGIDAKVGDWTPEWQTMLGQGAIAIQYGGCWMGGFIKGWLKPEEVDWTGKWGIFEVPADPGQNWGGSFLCIPQSSQNKKAAWAFIEFSLATALAQNKMFVAVDYFPAYKPAFDDPLYHEGDPFFGGQKTREMWVDIALNKIKPFVTTPMDAQAEQIFMSYVAQALDQGLDAQETLTKAAKEMETQTAADKEAALKLKAGK